MTRIQELFDDAVSTVPPSRLTADAVLGVARHRRRTATAVAASVSLVLVGLTTIGIGMGLAGSDTANPPSGAAPPGPLVWAGRGDADHLYRVTYICGENPLLPRPSDTPPPSPEPIRSDCNMLWASADGGATWIERGLMTVNALTVAGPLTLLRWFTSAEIPNGFELSRDGGATWTPLGPDGPEIDKVPPGGVVQGWSATGLLVVDTVQGRLQRMPVEVALTPDYLHVAVVPSGGVPTIWISGRDTVTSRPAVAVSHDGGATWTQRVLPNISAQLRNPPPPEHGLVSPAYVAALIASADARTAYVGVYDYEAAVRTPDPAIPGTAGFGWYREFRTTDGGATWLEVDDHAVMPTFRQGWITRDGRLVLHIIGRELGVDATAEYVVSPDGRTWALAEPPGLPAGVYYVDGSVAYTDHAMYVSDDGWTWREVWHD
jgi:hypothetical protein